MKKVNKSKNYLKIISQIENIRKKNNVNWMNILRIAFKYNPKATSRVMCKIYSDDKRIGVLVKKLT
jgi:predicted metallopeptidase